MSICLHCDKEFEKKVKHQKFCKDACRNAHNVLIWKKRNAKKCKACGVDIEYDASTNTCRKCLLSLERKRLMEMKINDYLKTTKGKGKDIYAGIRSLARNWNDNVTTQPCKRCGYNKHTELAHIIAICDFDKELTLSDVNHPNNVMSLCRNCHWEFDYGELTMDEILNAPVAQSGIEQRSTKPKVVGSNPTGGAEFIAL